MVLRFWQKMVLAVVVAVFVSGMGIAAADEFDGGWTWNSRISVEGEEIATQWQVNDGANPYEALAYGASITVQLPKNASASLISKTLNESVRLQQTGALACNADGVQAVVSYRIASLGEGTDPSATVDVRVTHVATGQVLGLAAGRLDQSIDVSVVVPVQNPSCAAS